MHLFYLFSVWFHILAAVVWIGGMIFLSVILLPVIRRPEFRTASPLLVHFSGVRFRWIGWLCLVVLVFTGAFNLIYRGITWEELRIRDFWQSQFGVILSTKLILVVSVLLLSMLHDFFIGPKASALGRADPGSPDALRFRRYASWFGRVNLFLALVIVAFGIMLVRGASW